jgi:cell division septation protein DedD
MISKILLLFFINIIFISLSFAKNTSETPKSDKYIIQVGIFNSSYNANQIMKHIVYVNDEFTLVKKKKEKQYIIYFDDFKNEAQADSMAESLKSLNFNYDFYVTKEK